MPIRSAAGDLLSFVLGPKDRHRQGSFRTLPKASTTMKLGSLLIIAEAHGAASAAPAVSF